MSEADKKKIAALELEIAQLKEKPEKPVKDETPKIKPQKKKKR